MPETAEPAVRPPADFALDVYDLDRAYVSEMASDLQKAHIHRSREEGKPFMDERYQQIVEARNHPDEQLERRVYESRKSMWDAEKRLKAAEKALSNEDEREKHLKRERMQRRVKEVERRAPVRTPRSADKDTQFDE